jgi:hypothetical protein
MCCKSRPGNIRPARASRRWRFSTTRPDARRCLLQPLRRVPPSAISSLAVRSATPLCGRGAKLPPERRRRRPGSTRPAPLTGKQSSLPFCYRTAPIQPNQHDRRERKSLDLPTSANQRDPAKGTSEPSAISRGGAMTPDGSGQCRYLDQGRRRFKAESRRRRGRRGHIGSTGPTHKNALSVVCHPGRRKASASDSSAFSASLR